MPPAAEGLMQDLLKVAPVPHPPPRPPPETPSPISTRLSVQDIYDEKGKPRPDVLKKHFVREGRIDEEAALRIINEGKDGCSCAPAFCRVCVGCRKTSVTNDRNKFPLSVYPYTCTVEPATSSHFLHLCGFLFQGCP